jgi:hypothetical protein
MQLDWTDKKFFLKKRRNETLGQVKFKGVIYEGKP